MAYDLKITGLANKHELLAKGPSESRLYKFSLNRAPDGFWVLLLQQAGLTSSGVTLSANANQTELWALAPSDVSVKKVLDEAKRAVAQANADADASDERFTAAQREQEAAARSSQEQLVAEIDELQFEDDAGEPSLASSPVDEGSGGGGGGAPSPS